MNTALRITPFTPKLGRTTRIKRASKKDDTFLDTHDDKPVYVTFEDLETSDDRMKRFSSAWMNKYATRNGSPTHRFLY